MADLVRYDCAEGVATLTLNRPERRNALSGDLVDAAIEALDRLDQDADAVAAVLTGEGKAFCSGGDLAGGMMGDGGVLEARRSRGRFAELLAALHACGKPVVAGVNGDALGGGFGLMMACDLAVVAPTARLGTPEIRVGLFPHIILAELSRNVPRKRLLEMILTGRHLSPDEALSWGLINGVEDPALEGAHRLASSIARHSPAILRLGKAAFYDSAELEYAAALRYLREQLEANLLAEDAAEGITAFLQKRAPEWRGR